MTGMSFQKRLSSFPHRSNEDQLLICKHCNNTLICCQEGTSSSSYEWKNCWLAFMWNMFKDLPTICNEFVEICSFYYVFWLVE